ncbi:hypothetical protein HRbin27_00935 [bacterium HR27]|nr:hypothetical protein HRbin27_00935 [bacterium HR27]
MASAELIVRTLLALQEAAQTAFLAYRVEAVATTGDQLMGIRLVADVPDDLVVR